MNEILDLYSKFESTYIRVLAKGTPVSGAIPNIKRALYNLQPHIMILLPCVNIMVKSIMYPHNTKSTDIGLCDSNTSTIQVATTYYKNGEEYCIPTQQVINTVLHELGHAIEDYFGDHLSHGLSPFIERDIKHLSYGEKKRCKYFTDSDMEMFAETFSYLAGSKYIIALNRKTFAKQFPHTIKEVARRLDELREDVEKQLIDYHRNESTDRDHNES